MTKQRIATAFAPVLAALALVTLSGAAAAALDTNGPAKDGLSVPGAIMHEVVVHEAVLHDIVVHEVVVHEIVIHD